MKIHVDEAPPEVLNFINQHNFFSRSGDPYRGEGGGDYIMEMKNNHLKIRMQCLLKQL